MASLALSKPSPKSISFTLKPHVTTIILLAIDLFLVMVHVLGRERWTLSNYNTIRWQQKITVLGVRFTISDLNLHGATEIEFIPMINSNGVKIIECHVVMEKDGKKMGIKLFQSKNAHLMENLASTMKESLPNLKNVYMQSGKT